MPDANTAFVGSIPENYDRYLGPLFFEAYARDLANRVPLGPATRVLEIASGTGIVTRLLQERLPAGASLVATDLNEAMIEYARPRIPAHSRVTWQTADGTSLPFPDQSFDVVVCQFGVMFFPDKVAGAREAYRVLRPGGRWLFNVWDSMESNPISSIGDRLVTEFFPANPPDFFKIPWGFHDRKALQALPREAGFTRVRHDVLTREVTAPSARDLARGMLEGSPMATAIRERGGDFEVMGVALAARLAAAFGDHPLRAPEQAIVITADK